MQSAFLIPGPVGPWNIYPMVQPGYVGPLLGNPLAEIETPEIQMLGVGLEVTYRRWGWPVGYLPDDIVDRPTSQWAKGPAQPWGASAATNLTGDFEQYDNPQASPERVQWIDRQRCVDVDPAEVSSFGVTYEIVRVDVPLGSVGVIERLPTVFTVDALDEGGVPMFSYGAINGERPCLSELVHPDPAVTEPLTWRWELTEVATTSNADDNTIGYQGPVDPMQIQGDPLAERWSDLKWGTNARWADELQIVLAPHSQARLWVTFFGPPNRFRINVGARIGGYRQSGGRRGAAVRAATQRM